MTDMWFQLKEYSKYIRVLKSYSDAWEFIKKVASGKYRLDQLEYMASRLLEDFGELDKE